MAIHPALLKLPADPGEIPPFDAPLRGDTAVISCHFNPCGYESPRRNLRRWLAWMRAREVPVYMAELSYGAALPLLPKGRRVLHLRTDAGNVMFHKENLLNLLVPGVPAEFRKLLWIDADVIFTNQNWFAESAAMLDGHLLGQLFSRGILTDREGAEVQCAASTGAAFAAGARWWEASWHPGFAWGARRELWEKGPGIFAAGVNGAGDQITAAAAGGAVRKGVNFPLLSLPAQRQALEYERRLEKLTGGEMGVVRGDAIHLWHGDRERRNYDGKRRAMAVYDPADVKTRGDGLLEWAGKNTALEAAVRESFFSRREDG